MHRLSHTLVIGFALLLCAGLYSTSVFSADSATAQTDAVENVESSPEKTEKDRIAKTIAAGSGLNDANMAGNLVQTTLGLLVVLLVIGAAAWAFKRFGNVHVGAQGRMKIIGGISLGTRERAVLLQVGEQQLVIGVAPGRVQTLHVLDTPLPVDDKPSATESFAARLQGAMRKRKGDTSGGED